MRGFRAVALAAILFTIVQIVLGAVTRLTNAGLSCPDWPLCYGLWFPGPADLEAIGAGYTFGQVMAEWSHRFNAAALVGPATLIAAILAWRRRRAAPSAWTMMVLAMILLLIQSGLGGFTVLDRNSPWSVATHLALALVFLGVLIAARRAAEPEPEPGPPGLIAATFAAAVAVLITVASGAMVAKSGATLACATWPLCDGAVIPDLSDPLVRLHFGHRVLAALTAGAILLLFVAIGRRGHRPLKDGARLALFLISVQILAGAGVVAIFAGDSLAAQVVAGSVHQLIGAALFAVLVAGACRAIPWSVGDRGGGVVERVA